MSIKLELDVAEFTKTIQQYAEVSKKDEETIVKDRGGKLAFELFKQFKAITPSIATLRALPKILNGRIKRRFKGATVKQEIRRRIGARTAAAIGWIPSIQKLSKRSARTRKKNPRGRVVINLREPSVTIVNSMPQAIFAEKKYNLLSKSIARQIQDMRVYINRKLEQRANQFSK